MKSVWIALLTATTAASGCSSSDSSGTGGAGGATGTGGSGGSATSSHAEICAAAFSREKACSPSYASIEVEWLDWCEGSAACFDKAFDPAYVAAYWACRPQLACGESDDGCGESVALENYGKPDVRAALEGCQAKKATCCGDTVGCPHGFSDDLCAAFTVVDGAWRAALQACVEGPCDQVRSCWDAFVASESCAGYTQPPTPDPVPPTQP